MGIFGLWENLVLESWKSMYFRISRKKLPPRSDNLLTVSPSGPFNSLCFIVLIYKLRIMIFPVIKLKWDRHVHMPSTSLLRRNLTNATEIMIMIILIYFHAVTTSCVRLFKFELCLYSFCQPLPTLAFWPYLSPLEPWKFSSVLWSAPPFVIQKINSRLGVSETVPG